MFIPLRDDNSLKSIPFQYVTVGLIAVNVLVFVLEVSGLSHAAVASFGVTPRELFGGSIPGGAELALPTTVLPSPRARPSSPTCSSTPTCSTSSATCCSCGCSATTSRMRWGTSRFLVFYLACGVFAGLFHAWMVPDSDMPLIGASGAVAGVIAAYLMLHPRVSVWVLAFKVIPLRITAGLVLGIWIADADRHGGDAGPGPIAWWAHIGGLIAGRRAHRLSCAARACRCSTAALRLA